MNIVYLIFTKRNNSMKNIIYLIISLLFFPPPIQSSSIWQRRVVSYERSQYKAGFQNWMITQAENGWIYYANSNGLLEFDGVNWFLYPIPRNVMRSVKIIDGKIFIGGSTEFGFFTTNENGQRVYQSLSEKTNHWGGEVWNIVDGGVQIFFLAEHYIHIYNKASGGVITIDAVLKIDCSTFYNGHLLIGTPEGVYFLDENNNKVLLPSSETLKGEKLVSMLPYGDKLLVTTARNGLYLLDEYKIEKVNSIADDFIRNNQLFYTSLSGSKVALGSVQNGVFLLDLKDDSYKETFNLNSGLNNNTILSSFFDKDQNLWLGLNKGISYINLNSPIRPLFANTSPIGTGYCSVVYNDDLYLGTNQALYKVDKTGKFHLIKGSEGQIWSLIVIDNTLFSTGDNGILIITPNDMNKINVSGAWEIHPLAATKDKLIVGTYSGFSILEKINGRWIFSHRVPDFLDSSRGFIEDEENYTFWVVNTNSQMQRVTFDPSFTKILSRKTYSLKNSMFDANTIFRYIDNNLVVCTTNGLYYYSRITDSFDQYTPLESMLDGLKYYEYLYVDKFKNIWFVSDSQLKMLPYNNGYKGHVYNWGLSDELIDSYENIFLLDSTRAIVSVDNAFVRLDLSQKGNLSQNIRTYIRKLTNSRDDSIISYGNTSIPIVLPYELNSIKVHYAASDYTKILNVLYSYRLNGLDNEWSTPTSATSKDYTNLMEGKYTFEVRTIVNGIVSQTPASFSFTVNPPWYRSFWAYVSYITLVVLLLYLLYKKTISKQKMIIHQKGEELIAQSKRFAAEAKQKDEEISELQTENLKNELKYKTHEINGYILNLIRKNEMLEDVKKNALGISKAIDEEKEVTVIRQKVMRLIGQINSNIEHDVDFSVFQSNFDLIHKDFFKLLDEQFPELTRNDKILCAYLNMNLSSKEIAPLLNISIRGVEVNRYRLRKKMNLERDINLTDFLQGLK